MREVREKVPRALSVTGSGTLSVEAKKYGSTKMPELEAKGAPGTPAVKVGSG